MNVYEIMTANPVTIDQYSSIADALERMRAMHCHHLPVLSAASHLIGILSEYDCQQFLLDAQADPAYEGFTESQLAARVPVQAVMSTAPIVVEPDMSAHQAARLMLTNNIRSLPVMRAETLVGIVTTSDLLIAFMQMSNRRQENSLSAAI